jgi:hypothetical protein
MANYNDGEITSIFVGQSVSPGVEDDAPNSPNAAGKYNVTLEMVAGQGLVSGDYTVTITCADLSAVTKAPASLIPGAPLNDPNGQFGSAAWTKSGDYWTFDQTRTVNTAAPLAASGHVFQYTAALVSKNGAVVSIRQSDPFILV